jgi:perosamine synthetase
MIPDFRPTIRRADMDAVLSRLAEDSIGAGTLSREFSQSLARYVGKRSGIAFRSFGHALEAVVAAMEIPFGGRVGVSVLAPVAVRNTLERKGCTVVPIDTDRQLPVLPSPLNFDYEALNLSALYADCRLGYVPDLENLRRVGVPLIEDISEGLGGNTGSSMVGSLGEIAMVSLEPEHIITAGGGAVVITNNTKRVSVLSSWVDQRIGEPPLPDMNAALGLTQLKQIEKFIERRKEIAARFVRVVQKGRYRVPLQGGDGDNVFFALPVMIDSSPREAEKYAQSHGVTVRRAFTDTLLSAMTVTDDGRGDGGDPGGSGVGGEGPDDSTSMADSIADAVDRFPNGIAFSSQMVLFPLFPTLAKAEQERIERVLATLP